MRNGHLEWKQMRAGEPKHALELQTESVWITKCGLSFNKSCGSGKGGRRCKNCKKAAKANL